MSERLSPEQLEEALQELGYLTICRCEEPWTTRGLHDVHCKADYRGDWETAMSEVRRLSAENQQLLALFKKWNLTADA